jgi:hypothetical protein
VATSEQRRTLAKLEVAFLPNLISTSLVQACSAVSLLLIFFDHVSSRVPRL